MKVMGDFMAYDAHDNAVMQRINRHIREVNTKHPEMTVAQKLETAWSNNIAERELDSTNIIGRDADYYFAARHELAKSDGALTRIGKGALGEAGWLVYAGLKGTLDGLDSLTFGKLGLGKVMRTDKDKPNAPVGGFVWMNRGIADAIEMDLADSVRPAKQHFWLAGDGSNTPGMAM